MYLGGQHDENIKHQLVIDSHHKLLGFVIGNKERAKDVIFYSYTINLNDFAATLEEEEYFSLSELP